LYEGFSRLFKITVINLEIESAIKNPPSGISVLLLCSVAYSLLRRKISVTQSSIIPLKYGNILRSYYDCDNDE